MHLFHNTSDTELESKKLSAVRNTKAIFDIACTLPTMLEASTDLAFYDTMISALTNWSVCGFKESLQYTIKFLRKSGICVNENGSDLCSIMNGVLEHDVRIGTKQHSHQVSPKGLLLLYCFAEYFNCTVFLFSTRKKPTIIKPVERDGATRKFAALLSHQDSYMQKTTWFSLTRKDGFTPNPSAFKAPSLHANVSNASEARSAATMSIFNKPKMVSFIGNWHRNTQYLRGHSTRSMKLYMSTLSTRSTVRLVDEYNSTKICCSCFKETQKQLVRDEDNRMKRNLGAVTCFNPECPKRLAKQTTMNRDEQGASNIALIGFSALVSLDNKVLPPFSRVQNPDKYILSPTYSHVFARQTGNVRTPA